MERSIVFFNLKAVGRREGGEGFLDDLGKVGVDGGLLSFYQLVVAEGGSV